jgi:hypothetical protein
MADDLLAALRNKPRRMGPSNPPRTHAARGGLPTIHGVGQKRSVRPGYNCPRRNRAKEVLRTFMSLVWPAIPSTGDGALGLRRGAASAGAALARLQMNRQIDVRVVLRAGDRRRRLRRGYRRACPHYWQQYAPATYPCAGPLGQMDMRRAGFALTGKKAVVQM